MTKIPISVLKMSISFTKFLFLLSKEFKKYCSFRSVVLVITINIIRRKFWNCGNINFDYRNNYFRFWNIYLSYRNFYFHYQNMYFHYRNFCFYYGKTYCRYRNIYFHYQTTHFSYRNVYFRCQISISIIGEVIKIL